MHKVTATTVANVDIQTAWQKLSDLSKAHLYVPDLTRTEITTELKQGVGTSRRVHSIRPTIIETVVEWNEGTGFKLKLHNDAGDGVPPLFSRASFTYTISKESDKQTRLTNSMEFQMKWGMLGNLLAKLITKPMQAMQEQIVVGQRLYYETGEKAVKEQVIEILKRG